jgi:hypothetical protein
MNTRDHGWTSCVVLNYSQTSPAGFDFVNTDVIRGETSYEYRTLRDTVFERAWWAPLVTVHGRARTELDVPATQPSRWADVDGLLERYPVLTLGASELQVRLEGDFLLRGIGTDQREAYYVDNAAFARIWGPLFAYAQLELFALRSRGPLQDLFDPGAVREWATQLRFSAGLAVTANGSLQTHWSAVG